MTAIRIEIFQVLNREMIEFEHIEVQPNVCPMATYTGYFVKKLLVSLELLSVPLDLIICLFLL